MNYIVAPEYIACVLLTVIAGYALFDKNRPSFKQTVFRISLIISLFSILTNIGAVVLMQRAANVRLRLSITVNTFSFLLTPLMTASVATASVVQIFEGRYESLRFRRAVAAVLILCTLQMILAFVNLFTGWLFSFDADGNFIRGPLNDSNAGYLLICVLITLLCYVMERKNLKRSFRFIIYTILALIVGIGLFQYLHPEIILSGTIAACALLVLFISGQQQRINIDPLTELPSREAFYQTLERLVTRGIIFRVVIISLRDYKMINNHYGQRIGDGFLQAIGEYLLKAEQRAAAYRFSGVEFAVVVSDLPEDQYEAFFQKLLARFNEPWMYKDYSIEIHAVLADIACPEHAGSVNELVASLEYAVRLAKEGVPGKPVRFDKKLRNEFGRRNYVLSQLETALKKDRFFLYFQPVYDCEQRRYTGGEVLLRLNEESGLPISPGEFIPLAIESGIANVLGWMVLEKTCRFLHDNADSGIEWLSVNVSAQQYEFDETFRRLEVLLEQYQIPPSRIKLEITERVLIDDVDTAAATMTNLNSLGVGIFLDDFGTGYSNLVNVMSLPFECVKIDKGFIRGVAQSKKSYGMLETVVRGLRALRVVVLAEGIETPEQDEIVKGLGIDRIQGYYYARPMPGEEFAWLLRQSSPSGNTPA